MNKLIVAIISIAVLACILLAVVYYINPNTNTGTTGIGTIQIGNIKSDRGVLQAELQKPLPSITNSAKVYTINKPVVDQAYIKHLNDQFGFNGKVSPVTGPEGETIINDGNKSLEIFKDGGFLYISPKVFSNAEPTNLPSKDKAIEIAEKYLKDNNLFNTNPDTVSINPIYTQVYDSHNKTLIKGVTTSWSVGFDPLINGCKIVGPGDHLGVYIGDNGEIIMMNVVWRETTEYKQMNLKSTNQALSDLINGKGEVLKASDNGNKVIITNASIGYYAESGLVDQKFIQPVYIFDGDMYEGNTLVQAGGFSAYVPALENENELSANI